MNPTTGQLQALYELPVQPPAAGAEPPLSDPPTLGETMAHDAWALRVAAEVDYRAAVTRRASDARSFIGVGEHQYSDDRVIKILETARRMAASVLVDVSPEEGAETRTYTSEGRDHVVRAVPLDALEPAIYYIARALYFDGLSKADEVALAERHAKTSGPDATEPGIYHPPVFAGGPAGTNRLVDRSGAGRMLAPFIRRSVTEVPL